MPASAFPLTTLLVTIIIKMIQIILETITNLASFINALLEKSVLSKAARILIYGVMMRRLLGFVLSRARTRPLAGLQTESEPGLEVEAEDVPGAGTDSDSEPSNGRSSDAGSESKPDAGSMSGSPVLDADSDTRTQSTPQSGSESEPESTSTSTSASTFGHASDSEDQTLTLPVCSKAHDEEGKEQLASPLNSQSEPTGPEPEPCVQEQVQEENEPDFSVDQDPVPDEDMGADTSASTFTSTGMASTFWASDTTSKPLVCVQEQCQKEEEPECSLGQNRVAGTEASADNFVSTSASTASTFQAADTTPQPLPPVRSRLHTRPLLMLGPPSPPPSPSMPALTPSPISSSSPVGYPLPSFPQLPPAILGLAATMPVKASIANRSKPSKDGKGHEVEFTLEMTGYVDPASLPNNIKLKEPIADDAFEISYVNKAVGFGMFATREIREGEIIFADKLLTVSDEEEFACQSRAEASALLEGKAKMLGKTWFARYLHFMKGERWRRKFAGSRPKVAGVMGPFWEKCSLPTAWNGKVGSVFGLNLAYVNHACVPNCSLGFRNKYITDEHGAVLWDEEPELRRAVVRASRDIPAGDEISIAYMQTRGLHKMRREQIYDRFGFFCQCEHCTAFAVTDGDYALDHCPHLLESLSSPNVITDGPAAAFQAAATVIDSLQKARMCDARLLDMLIKCALVAGHHSDMARAHYFLKWARELSLVIEGMTSSVHRQIECWFHEITSMPGFGATVRGLSSITEASILDEDDSKHTILFMLGTHLEGYARMSRYRAVKEPGNLSTGDGMAAADEAQRWEVVDGLDPIPSKVYVMKAELPQDMCRCQHCCHAAERLDRMARRRQAQRRRKQFSKRKACKKMNPECNGHMKDFLACYRGVNWDSRLDERYATADVRRFEIRRLKRPTRKETAGSRTMQTQTPVVKDVGAEMKPKVVLIPAILV
ncbi:uncharacterized protein BDV17DRAFT_294854 [Aspergillus undulatus]|uniref:uncharacterized protein n=1 Tax=Aspergillus undulatus TaxID=1810928 RepID=UPI003CCCBBBF